MERELKREKYRLRCRHGGRREGRESRREREPSRERGGGRREGIFNFQTTLLTSV